MSKHLVSEHTGNTMLAMGLLLVGLAVGFISGLSTSEGTGKALMAALFSFVAGTLMGYVGFRRGNVSEGDASEVEPRRVGAGLAAVSSGVVLGVMLGIWLRNNPPSFMTPGYEAAVEKYGEVLRANDADARKAAAIVLARLGTPRAMEILAEALAGAKGESQPIPGSAGPTLGNSVLSAIQSETTIRKSAPAKIELHVGHDGPNE